MSVLTPTGLEFKQRVSKILNDIEFQDKNQFIFNMQDTFYGMNLQIFIYKQVMCVETNILIPLTHFITVDEKMSDEAIIKKIFILVAQFVLHECAENFKSKNQRVYNPHEGTRNQDMFKAIEQLVKPVEQVTFLVVTDATVATNATAEEPRKLPQQKKFFDKFSENTRRFDYFYKKTG